jgi:protein-tyrosine phosphatase
VTQPSESAPGAFTVDGLANVRDLGGLARRGGEVTPHGVFFRAESVDAVTTDGWGQIHAAGIRTVVDLRQAGERARDVRNRPSWLTTRHVDLDGLENRAFWKDYWGTGIEGTALYYLPFLSAMPERAGGVLTAIVTAPTGGVLFHCSAGRDRTGLVAMLLLAAVGTAPDAIVGDYLETVRLGEVRANASQLDNMEPRLERFCRAHGTTTEGAFRTALDGVDFSRWMTNAGMGDSARQALLTWRGSVVPGTTPCPSTGLSGD